MTKIKSTALLIQRFELERQIRQYFWSVNFIEVRTPLLVQSPGMEPHIRPIQIKSACTSLPTFLPTSPEFGMKKLIANGVQNIFQICPSFRDEPHSPEHHPEFTMLEFYESNVPLLAFQQRVEDLIKALVYSIHKKYSFSYQGRSFHLEKPWPRYRVVDLFQEFLGIDLRTHQTSSALANVCNQHKIAASEQESWDDLYFKLWLNLIEPRLPQDQLFFVTHYPVSQSSLCIKVKDETGFEWASRFEVYAGRLELGNAFEELRDPLIQRKNFLHDQQIRRATYGDEMPESPIDEELLKAIERMPPTCGIAMGVDRLAMLILDAPHIDAILPLPSHWS